MAKKKASRARAAVPRAVADALKSLGILFEAIKADAEAAEIERRSKAVTLRVLNFCEVPVVLTFGDEGEAKSLTLRPTKLPAVPKQEVGVVIVAPWPLAARMDVEGRTDVWAVPRS